MNWYKKAELKNTDDIIYDIYKSIVDAVGGNWTVKPITEEKDSKVYWLQSILSFALYGSDVIKKGDQFSTYVRIWTKRASGKVIHPYDGSYEGVKGWEEGKLNPIKDYTDFATSGEELRKRWQAIYNLPPEDATKYDSEYGNRLFDIQIKLYGTKPNTTKEEEYRHDRISITSELDTPAEIAEHVKTEINRFYFGGEDDGGNENEPIDPTGGEYVEPEITYNDIDVPVLTHNMNWYKTSQENIEDRLGLCYELSGRYVSGHPNSELIHGSVTNRIPNMLKGIMEETKTLEHAWVEYNNIVFDPVIGQEYQKEVYYALFEAKVIERYNYEEVLKITLKDGNWGPWNEQNPPNKDCDLDELV